MPRLRNFRNIIGVGLLGLGLVGCVPAEQYAGLKMDRDRLAEQLGHSQTEIADANAQRDAAIRQLQAVNNNTATEGARDANLESQIAELTKENSDWSQKYADAMSGISKLNATGPALNPTLDSALKTFADQNPDLIEFDSGRGVVKFKSDVTFGLGETAVTAKADEVLKRFASILNSSGADGYELMIAGHTDNVPVTNPKTIKAGNFDNWYLSCHRAISVAKVLITSGVSSSRMGVVGYADKRPIASNASESGKAQNRRVEVLILPTTVRTPSVASSSEAAPRVHKHAAGAAVPAAATINKDSPSAVTFTK